MTLVLGAWTIGLLLALLAMGVFISFRVFAFPDITADGSITLGAAVSAVLIVRGCEPLVATAAGFLAGMAAGATTGLLHTKFGINSLLSGILVMTGLYTVNLVVMGRSNIPLQDQLGSQSTQDGVVTLSTYARRLAVWVTGSEQVRLFGWSIQGSELFMFLFGVLACTIIGGLLYLFFRTNLGTAMRASGDNAQMMRALGVDVGNMTILGLALSNGLVALSGSLFAQYQGFVDVQMGIGMVVWGLASVIIGEALVGARQMGLILTGTVMGSVLFRLLVAGALLARLNPNYLKLATAVFVFVALVLPGLRDKLKRRI